jgi:hypothetical protein
MFDNHLYTIPMPWLDFGKACFQSAGYYDGVVIVDTQKFYDLWLKIEKREQNCWTRNQLARKYTKNAQYMGGDDNPISPFHTTRDQAIARLNNYYNDDYVTAFELPKVSYFPKSRFGRDHINFTNGRHRLINHIMAGAKALPIEMTWDTTKECEKDLGFKGLHGIGIEKSHRDPHIIKRPAIK